MTLCYTDIETREALRRMKEVAFAFGATNMRKPEGLTSDVKLLQEFLAFLREREPKRKGWYRHSPQIKHRTTLLNFMMRLCASEKLTLETTYQSVYMLDRFMDGHDIAEHQLGLVVIVCVVIAGKLLEIDNRGPKFKAMASIVKNSDRGTIKKLVALEGYILESFNFDVLVPTEINFLEIYLLYVIDGHIITQDADCNNNDSNNNDDNNNNNHTRNANQAQVDNNAARLQSAQNAVLLPANRLPGAELIEKMYETAFEILEEVSRREPDINFKPSLIAASILIASRREHGLNFWTPTLTRITSYNLEQVSRCLRVYLEPRVSRIKFKKPFDQPMYTGITFEPYILVEDSEPL